MTVGVVLVHFRFWPEVKRTLEALFDQTRLPDQVLVVDDCSGDGSVEALRGARPDLEILVAPHNRGAIANFNAGLREMRRRGVDAVLLLTHEALLERDVLEQLVGRLEAGPGVGAAGPLLGFLSRPGLVFSAGGELLAAHVAEPPRGDVRAPGGLAETGDSASSLARRCVRAGEDRGARGPPGAPPRALLPLHDDVELGVRLNQAGWAVQCVCSAVARQEPGLLAEYYRVRNRLGFLRATAPRRILARALRAHLAQTAATLADEAKVARSPWRSSGRFATSASAGGGGPRPNTSPRADATTPPAGRCTD